VDEEAFEGTLAERLVHKSWKARQAAAIELKALFEGAADGNAPCFSEYAGQLPKLLGDSNVSVLGEAVAAAISYADKAANAAQITESIAKPLVEKCLGANRVAVRSAAETLALLLLEVDQPQSTAVLNALAAGSANRLAKIARPSLVCMQKALAAFGAQAISASVIAQALPPIFSSAKDRKVREEAVKTAVELYRWMGDALMPLLDEVRDSQKKELEAEFEKLSAAESPTPTSVLRCLADVAPAEQAKIQEKAAATSGAVDLFGKEPAVLNLLKVLDVKEFFSGMREEKWNLRKTQIDNLVEIAGKADTLAEGDYGEMISVLKKSLKDSNMAVVASAIRALGLLGHGLRKDFSMHMASLLPEFMDNYRNKNRGVLNAVDFALDSMHLRCYIITEVLDTVCEFAASKVPAARTKMFGYVERAVMQTPPKSLRKANKQLCGMLMKGIDDKTPEARDAALQTTGALLHVLDEDQLSAIMTSSKMDKHKAKRIREHAAKLSGEALPAETVVPATQRTRKTLNQAPPPKVGPKVAKSSNAPAPKKAAPAPVAEVAVAPAVTDDQVSATIEELVPSEIVTMLGNKSFKFKVEGIANLGRLLFGESIPAADEGIPEELAELMNALHEKVPELDAPPAEKSLAPAFEGVEHISEIVVRFLGKTIANFKDSNFMVVNGLWGLVARLAESPGGMSKYAAGLAVPAMLEKISDRKIKASARSCLTAIAEICTPNFVYEIAYATLKKAKSPPLLAETMDWIAASVVEFGVATVNVSEMLSACVGCLDSSNAAVRKNTIGLVALMHSYIGAGLLDLLSDVKASTRDLIEKEIARRGDAAPVEPTREIKCEIEAVGGAAAGGELPRADISDLITSQLLTEMKDPLWKVRGAALDAVEQTIVSAGKRITPDVDELPRNLSMLFNDPNQSLKIKSMNLTGMMAAAMGGSPGITRHLQTLMPKMVANVCDNKSVVRDATLRNLDTVMAQVGIKAILPFAPEAFYKPQGTCDMMGWMLKHITAAADESLDLAPMVEPVVKCLLDRNAEVRSLAEQMLSLVVGSVGIAAVRDSPSVKSAGMTAAKDLAKVIAKYDPNSIESAAPVAAPATAAAAPARKPVQRTRKKETPPSESTADDTAAAAAETTYAVSSGPKALLRLSNKELRQKRESKKKGGWIMDDMKLRLAEYREDLKRVLVEICDRALLEELFHRDFKAQIAACAQLRERLGEYPQELVSSVDLLFKFVVLKIWETNSQSHAETIELMNSMLDQLAASDYCMTDYEASVIMPHWVEKVGSNNPSIRTGMRNCLHKFLQIYPMSKLYVYVLDGLDSKNTRTRVDCIEELGSLLGDNGLTVFDPKRTVPRIAKWVGNNDRNTSAAALDAMQKIFQLCEEPAKFFSLIGGLSDKQRAILDGRFKHNKAAASKIAAAKRSGGSARPASAPVLHSHPAPKEAAPVAPAAVAAPAPMAATVPEPIAAWSEPAPEVVVDSAAQAQLESMAFWPKLESSELEERVIGHKLFLAHLKKQGPDAIVPIANEVIVAVTKMMTTAFCRDCDSVDFFFRNCKYPTNTLMEMLNTPDIAL
jgi:cytoskeleton-associated protein 5